MSFDCRAMNLRHVYTCPPFCLSVSDDKASVCQNWKESFSTDARNHWHCIAQPKKANFYFIVSFYVVGCVFAIQFSHLTDWVIGGT